jgi:hypothetical protein
VTGHFDVELSAEFIALVDAWRAGRSGVHVFHDIRGVEDYDVEARERLTRWSRELGTVLESIHVLVERRTVAWGLHILSTVSGIKISSYHSAAAFEAAFERCRTGA